MTNTNNKLYIIVGHYGTGKSEFSLNYAKYLKTQGKEVAIADLDIVNPYFRSREQRQKLIELGIDVVSDTLNSTKGLDMPYLSPAIKGQIIQKGKDIVLDCGGDNVGIRVLRQFYKEIVNRDYEMLMMVNVFRPQTSNVQQIIRMKEKLEFESGLKVTGYVNNSNLLRDTTIEDMIHADQIIKELSEVTQIPIYYVSGMKKLIDQLPEDISGDKFILDMSLRNEWL